MSRRLPYHTISPRGVQALGGLSAYVDSCGLERSLIHLIELRVSQINGCAYCVDLHTREAREHGETERRLHNVIVWREAPFFTARERAALGWAEAVTLISETGAPDADYEAARAQLSDKELVDLTFTIANMNAWNRMAISFRHLPEVNED